MSDKVSAWCLQKLVAKIRGSSNKVVPAEVEKDESEGDNTEPAIESPSRPETNSLSDSDYSADSSYQSSSASDCSNLSSHRTKGNRVTPNPLLLAFPLKSDQQAPEIASQCKEIEPIDSLNAQDSPYYAASGKKGK